MSIPLLSSSTARTPPHAVVIVLGDLGRSPRMVNHARVLLARGWRVTLAGYGENALPEDVATHGALRVLDLTAGGAGRARAWWRLARAVRADKSWRLAVVQNPPGFPALWALPRSLRGRCVVIDWHNTGESLYALSRPGARVRRAVYAWCERTAARRATTAWAVSEALARAVAPAATVVHDAPAELFCKAATRPADRLDWWRRVLPGEAPPPAEAVWVVAPSSWGPDEDHGAILRVARHWAARACEWGEARPVVIVASGRGPARAAFEREAALLPAGPVTVRTVWLPPGEYPVLLAGADAGLSLHRSSSGLDLPMKRADMRGAGLPVLAYDYAEVLREAAEAGRDFYFKEDADLAECIHLLATKPRSDGAAEKRPATWEENWNRALGPWCAALENRAIRRVAILKPWLGLGGADRWSVDAALALAEAGWDATIWTNHQARAAGFSETRDGRVRVEVRAPGAAAGGGGDRWRVVRVILRQRALLRAMKREGVRPDLVICDVLPHVVPLVRRLWPEAAVFCYCHYPDKLMVRAGGWIYRLYRAPIDALEARGMAAADYVATNSQFTAEVMRRAFPGMAGRVPAVIYPGVILPAEPEFGPVVGGEVRKTFLTVSRIDPRKGLPLVVAAMAALRERVGGDAFARCRLVIAGGYDGNFSEVRALLEALRAQVREAGLSDQVEFRLNLSDAELAKEWGAAFALVHPMAGEHFGIVPVEAMARGLPVLAVNEGGPRETVVDGATGALREAEADAFADVMAGWLKAPEEARELGRAGRRRAEALFGRGRFAAQLCAAADEAMERRALR